ncbi:MAG: acyl-CoA/acyl-ACP dehydrogenase [Spirochaetes bacterium]|nr:acyl-CoA/acyl-ACP dehydrogenase [Spirochaetota bacterium]
MEYNFTAEELQIKETVKKFVKNEILPIYRDIEKSGELPAETNKKFIALNLLSAVFPEEYGGTGGTFTSLMLAVQEFGYASLLPASKILENFITALPVYRFGSDQLKKKYLPDLVSMKKIGAMAFTEPNTDSDPRQLVTVAKKVDGGWKLNGSKRFITHARTCDQMILYAKTEDAGVAAFLIDTDKPGYRPGKREKLMNMAMDNGDLFLEDYFVPDERIIGSPAQGFDILLQVEAMGKLGFSAIFTGTAERALDLAISYANTRMHRDKSIGVKFQYIQEKIDSAVLKLLVAEGIKQVTADAMEIHGAYSLSDEYDIASVYQLAAFAPVVMGSMDIQRTIAARTLLANGKYS